MMSLQLLVLGCLLLRGDSASIQNLTRRPVLQPTGCSREQWVTPIPNLNAAMEGFDPLRSDAFSRRNPGMRQQIFEPFIASSNGRVVLHDFIGKARQDIRCFPGLTTTTITSFAEYKASTALAYEFERGADVSGGDGDKKVNFKASAGYGRDESEHEQAVRSFLQETKGEIFLFAAECLTHSVKIDSFSEPAFTSSFKNAVKKLLIASKNPNTEESDSIVRRFFADYGTHYMREVELGSKLWFVIRLKEKSEDDSKQQQQQQCVENSLSNILKDILSSNPTFSDGDFAIALNESRKFVNLHNHRCYKSIQSVDIVSVGAFPRLSMTVTQPVPISATIDKISNLFQNILLNSEASTNGGFSAVVQFIEEKTKSYCELMTGRECDEPSDFADSSDRTNLSVSSTSEATQECSDNQNRYTCKLRYGPVIIVGGYAHSFLKTVEVLNASQLPDLPEEVQAQSLTAVGNVLYNCGGHVRVGLTSCYKMNTSASSPRWTQILDLPRPMWYHSAVAVGRHIWFVFQNQLDDFDTVGESFTSYRLPFEVQKDHCAVTNGSHSYVIGVGSTNTEVWVNSWAHLPNEWKRVATLIRGKRFHACLWLGSEVYITGGHRWKADVEVLNTDTHEVAATGSLVTGRRQHGMMVLDGSPAVVGGSGNGIQPLLNSIEIYNMSSKSWSLSNHKLQDEKSLFGIAQLLVANNT